MKKTTCVCKDGKSESYVVKNGINMHILPKGNGYGDFIDAELENLSDDL